MPEHRHGFVQNNCGRHRCRFVASLGFQPYDQCHAVNQHNMRRSGRISNCANQGKMRRWRSNVWRSPGLHWLCQLLHRVPTEHHAFVARRVCHQQQAGSIGVLWRSVLERCHSIIACRCSAVSVATLAVNSEFFQSGGRQLKYHQQSKSSVLRANSAALWQHDILPQLRVLKQLSVGLVGTICGSLRIELQRWRSLAFFLDDSMHHRKQRSLQTGQHESAFFYGASIACQRTF